LCAFYVHARPVKGGDRTDPADADRGLQGREPPFLDPLARDVQRTGTGVEFLEPNGAHRRVAVENSHKDYAAGFGLGGPKAVGFFHAPPGFGTRRGGLALFETCCRRPVPPESDCANS
jgi:hypothetical protein